MSTGAGSGGVGSERDTGGAGPGRYSGGVGSGRESDGVGFGVPGDVDAVRAVALAGVGLLITSYASVFFYFIEITGSPSTFLVLTLATLGAATALSSVLSVRTATLVAVGLMLLGLSLYVITLPRRPPILPLVTDAIALTSGRTLLLVTNVDIWVLTVAPAPLFLTWYLALRRWYVAAVLVGGGTLGFLVLTGDAVNVTALLGVLGGIVAVAVGDMDRRGDSLAAAEPLAILLAAMILLSGIAPVVPSGPSRTASSWSSFQDGGAGPSSVEASLVNADAEMGIQGDLSLSPDVRFRMRSSEEAYWQVGSYDRYTGDGWIRTGGTGQYEGRQSNPPGESRQITQEVTAVDELGVLPAAWKPVSAGIGVRDRTRVTEEDGLALDGTLSENETASVTSRAPVASVETLRTAGTDYPSSVEDRYTGLPSNTPDRVGERTARLTANANNPYETALVVESWLQNNKSYSLDVDRPDGNVADEFLFEMDAGYCTYFATTMVAMLRTQDIPARMAVGYTPGERVAEDEWVVRGYNAHAWVQAYFPEVGWVRFDPTPSAPRDAVRQQELQEAREQNRTDVDLGDTGGEEWTPTPTATPAPLTPPDDLPAQQGQRTAVTPPQTPPGGIPGSNRPSGGNVTLPNETGAPANATDDAEGSTGLFGGVDPPSREEATLGGIFLIGLVVGVRRSGILGRAYRAVWLRYQPRGEPRADAERAFDRLEYVLADRYRPRRPDETPRQYLAAIGADERAQQVSLIRERARYAGRVTREEADEAISLVDDVVAG